MSRTVLGNATIRTRTRYLMREQLFDLFPCKL